MPDRDSFIATIAAAPADDLPRLVFADWLDEHGDPERAEFIRTQIQRHHADAEERKELDRRAADLFREHWPLWFGPFALASTRTPISVATSEDTLETVWKSSSIGECSTPRFAHPEHAGGTGVRERGHPRPARVG